MRPTDRAFNEALERGELDEQLKRAQQETMFVEIGEAVLRWFRFLQHWCRRLN